MSQGRSTQRGTGGGAARRLAPSPFSWGPGAASCQISRPRSRSAGSYGTVPVRRRPSPSRGAAAAAGGYAGAARLGLAWPIGAASSAPHFAPATADPAAHFSCAGPSRGVRRCRGLCALSGPTAGCWAGCVLAAAPLVRSDQLRAARKGRSRCGEFLRRQVLVCARIFGAPVRKPSLRGRFLDFHASYGRSFLS